MDWASRQDIENATQRWFEGQIACRSYGHRWNPLTVTHRSGVYTVRQRCTRCRNEREHDMDERGYAGPWRTTYREGYLLRDVGRIGADGRAVLRLATIRTMQVVEVDDDA